MPLHRYTDYETCSWCTASVPDDTLTEVEDGARVCRNCRREAIAKMTHLIKRSPVDGQLALTAINYATRSASEGRNR